MRSALTSGHSRVLACTTASSSLSPFASSKGSSAWARFPSWIGCRELTHCSNAAGSIQYVSSSKPQLEAAVNEINTFLTGTPFENPDLCIAFISPRFRWKQPTEPKRRHRLRGKEKGRRKRQAARPSAEDTFDPRPQELSEECPVERLSSLLRPELKRKIIGIYAPKETGEGWKNDDLDTEPHLSLTLARLPADHEVQSFSIMKDALPELRDMETLVLRRQVHFFGLSTGDWAISHGKSTLQRFETVFPNGGKVHASCMKKNWKKDLSDMDEWEEAIGASSPKIIRIAVERDDQDKGEEREDDAGEGGQPNIEIVIIQPQQEEPLQEGEPGEGEVVAEGLPASAGMGTDKGLEGEEKGKEEGEGGGEERKEILAALKGEQQLRVTRDFGANLDEVLAKFERAVEDVTTKHQDKQKEMQDKNERLSNMATRLLLDGSVLMNGGAVGLAIYSTKDTVKHPQQQQQTTNEALAFLADLVKYSVGNMHRRAFGCNAALARELFFPTKTISSSEYPAEGVSSVVSSTTSTESTTEQPESFLASSMTPSLLGLPERLPVFWLSKVVFPGNTLRLNIFEERYRLLMKECFDNNKPFVLISGKMDDKKGVGTLLYVTSYDDLHEDGCSNVTLKAGYRIAVKNPKIAPNSFGCWHAEVDQVVQDGPVVDKQDTEALAKRVVRLYKRLAKSWDPTYSRVRRTEEDYEVQALNDIIASDQDEEGEEGKEEESKEGKEGSRKNRAIPLETEVKRLSFYLADEIPLSVEEKYGWLTCTSTHERLKLQFDALRRLLSQK